MDIKEILNISIVEKASDLHILPDAPPMLRINGKLSPVNGFPVLDANMTQQLIDSVLTKDQKQIFETQMELDFTIILDSSDAGFRVNAFHQTNGVAAVFRVIPHEIPTLEDLSSPLIIKSLLDLPSGLILLAGPTGSGKSTSLAAMINHININKSYHIITIEDPIEFVHKRKNSIINQRQVNRDTLSFSAALRSALREDPDVLLVGEMRDLETIRLALTAAETGHLVLATIHATSAPRSISKIIDVFQPSEKNIIKNMLAESVRAIICQTLLQKIGGGRVAAYEVMVATPGIRNLIREDKIAQMYSVIQTSKKTGMITMEQAIKQLVDKNIISNDSASEKNFQRDEYDQLILSEDTMDKNTFTKGTKA